MTSERRRRRPRAHYRSECFDCDWTSNEESTIPAQRHAQKTGHTAACDVSRDYIYNGSTS